MGGYSGGTTAGDLLRLRRMVAEPEPTVYSDVMLTDAIERYPVPDPDDIWPDEINWFPTYDLAMAAAEVWSEKATNLAANFDFTADAANFVKSQQYDHYLKQERHWRSLRMPGMYQVLTPLAPDSGDFDQGDIP